MKFTDGYWQMRPGMIPYYAAQVHEVTLEGEALTILAPTKKLQGRGDTLNLPTLTVRYSSPLDGIIRVQVVHHKGAKRLKPEFALAASHPEVQISENEQTASLASGALSVKVHKGDQWLVEFCGGGWTIFSTS